MCTEASTLVRIGFPIKVDVNNSEDWTVNITFFGLFF